MIPIISIVGRKNSGKTTFITRLLPLLEEAGIRTTCVKQHRQDVPVDIEGKDSWLYSRAGAHCSIMSTATQLSLVFQRKEMASLKELSLMSQQFGSDLLIGESFNRTAEDPKIFRYVVVRKDRIEDPLFSPVQTEGIITDDLDLAKLWQCTQKPFFDLNNPHSFSQHLINITAIDC